MTAAALPRTQIAWPGERLRLRDLLDRVEEALDRVGLKRTGEAKGPVIDLMAGFGNAVENKILDHVLGDGTYTVTAPTYLALCTATVVETDTSASLTEANYTGYARKALAAADLSAAAAGSKTNSAQQTFANCTAGSSTIISWAICDVSAGAGDVIVFGTCASTVISTTQTPPTIAASGLTLTLD